MKKLLGVSALALLLTACSKGSEQPPQQPQPLTPQQVQQELDKALQECHAIVGNNNQAKFDACMDERGFEKVKTEEKPNNAKPAKQSKSKK